MLKAVFFDLDGTLADTAPDLAHALNRLRSLHQLPALPTSTIRPYASQGARGMLKVGFDLDPEQDNFNDMRDLFLAFYAERLCADTRLFPGIPELLAEIEKRNLPWGVITNKLQRFTVPLLQQLDLYERAACIVSGDNVPKPKPDPASLLYASKEVGVSPADCIYVGDDKRDVEAGHAAGMRVIVANYGYLGIGNDPATWQADGMINEPLETLNYLH